MKNLLNALHLEQDNSGTCFGPGHWCTAKTDTLISYNPTTEKPIASVYTTSPHAYDIVCQQAQQAFQQWRKVPAPQRGNIIRELGNLIREQKESLANLITVEMGKSKQEALGEVQEIIDMADFAVGQSRMLYGKTMHSERPEHRMYEQWHPLGVVGVITAFNFPVAVWAWNALLAAICGNTIIWKPSPKTPLCAIAIQHLCNIVMARHQLSGIFSIFITESIPQVENCVNDPRIPLISFTGSSIVGAKINELVARRMGRCLLECSGNNAIILDQSADLNLAIPSIVFGAVGTSGQRCTSTRRVFIHAELFDTVTTALINAYKKITIGDPLDENNLMGPLIDLSAVEIYQNAIATAKNQGGTVLYGGHSMKNIPGYFVEPTIISAQNEWPIVQRETFAPILYVIPYQDFHHAVQAQNNSCYGLSSALFTENLKNAEYFLSVAGSDCGIANINIGTSGAEIGGAFGGEKMTGGGREAGSDSWKAYMRRQTNTINWSQALPLAQGIKLQPFTTSMKNPR